MLTPRILSQGAFPISSIGVEICDNDWRATPEHDTLVDAEWERLLCSSPYPIWDGEYYRLLNPASLNDGTGAITFVLGTIGYRYIASFHALHEIHAESALEPLNHLSTVALIRTSDECYVFGRRAGIGTVDLIGGGVQPGEIPVKTGTDIEHNLYKEIHEETGISRSHIEDLEAIGIVQSSNSNILVVGHARTNLSKRDIEMKFNSRTEDEMKGLIFVPSENLRAFLKSMTDYRPLLASLLTGSDSLTD